MRKLTSLASMILMASTAQAFAVSQVVKQACSADYAAYCSEHKVGTSGLKSCMREHRKMLSDGCIKALGSSDEVSQQDIVEYKREMHRE